MELPAKPGAVLPRVCEVTGATEPLLVPLEGIPLELLLELPLLSVEPVSVPLVEPDAVVPADPVSVPLAVVLGVVLLPLLLAEPVSLPVVVVPVVVMPVVAALELVLEVVEPGLRLESAGSVLSVVLPDSVTGPEAMFDQPYRLLPVIEAVVEVAFLTAVVLAPVSSLRIVLPATVKLPSA